MQSIIPINISVPIENKEMYDKLFEEYNRLVEKYNEIMEKLKAMKPNINNYKKIDKQIKDLLNDVNKFLTDVLKWNNNFQIYELKSTYRYQGDMQQNFQQLDFKLTNSAFKERLNYYGETVLTSYNNIGNWIRVFESLKIAIKSLSISKWSLWISILALLGTIFSIFLAYLAFKPH